MELRDRLEDRIKKKEQEIEDLKTEFQNKVLEANAYIKGLQEALKMCSRDTSKGKLETTLKPGSMAQKTLELLKKEGRPMHIVEILEAIGREPTRSQKTSLAGSLTAYVRRNEIFNRPAPGTFGLIGNDKKIVTSELPDNFGQDDSDSSEINIDDEIPF